MKRLLLFLFFTVFSNIVFAQFVVDSTKTMNGDTFIALREATEPGTFTDEIMRFYWSKLIGVPMRDDDEYDREAEYHPINWSSYYAKESIWGAIGHEYTEHDPPVNGADDILDFAKDYLLDPGSDNYLDLNLVWNEFTSGWQNNHDFLLADLLTHCAFILDMLWYYLDDTPGGERDQMYAIVDNMANFVNIVIEQPNITGRFYDLDELNDPDWDGRYPTFFSTDTNNHRIYFTAALGYAGCVLGNPEYVTTAENDLFSPDLYNGHNGLLGLNMSNGGIYAESFTYANLAAAQLSLFFSARDRILIDGYTKNWFEDSEDVRNFYEGSFTMITPDFGGISWEDSDLQTINNNGELNPIYINCSQLIPYYYQAADMETKSNILWFLKGWDSNIFRNYKILQKLYSYKEVTPANESMPDYVKSSYTENSEFSILRKDINDREEFKNTPTLIINHENYIDQEGHEHSDQTSFILYYKGRQLLIDPGYIPAASSYYLAKEWLASPFAHNLIMVNPYRGGSEGGNYGHTEYFELEMDYQNPLDYYTGSFTINSLEDYWNDTGYNSGIEVDLGNPNNYNFKYRDFEPIGQTWFEWDHEELGIPPVDYLSFNPAQREYFVEHNDKQHIKVSISYDHPQLRVNEIGETMGEYNGLATDIIDIERNFYFVDFDSDNSYFVIFDEVTSSDTENSNDFMNQLHFAVHPVLANNTVYPWSDDLETFDNGKFKLETAKEVMATSSGCDKIYLYGAMGAGNTFQKIENPDLPQGQYMGRNWDNLTPPQWEHDCMRVISNDVLANEKFLTILYSSEDNIDPIIEIANIEGSYGTIMNSGVTREISGDTFSLYGVLNSEVSTSINFSNIQIESDVNFFGITSFVPDEAPQYPPPDLDNLIVNTGTYLIYNGTTVYEVHENNEFEVEEILASYTDGVCSIKVIPEDIQPKFKLLRNNSFLFDDCYFENWSYAYNDVFFFFNYEQEELPENAVIIEHNGNITITGTVYDGLNELYGPNVTITVQEDAALWITDRDVLFGSNCKIDIYGELYLYGRKLSSTSENWTGLYCHENGVVNLYQSVLENAVIGVSSTANSIINISESTIKNCETGVFVQNGSSLELISSEIIIPENGYGICNWNLTSESNVVISGTEELQTVFNGLDLPNTTGLFSFFMEESDEQNTICEFADFDGLTYGIDFDVFNDSESEIRNCSFNSCQNGINLIGNNGSIKNIDNCVFNNNQNGILVNYISTGINNCSFSENTTEIKVENVNPNRRETGGIPYIEPFIDSCSFHNSTYGVVSINSSPRITHSIFNDCIYSISTGDNSFPNISYDSFNVFDSNYHICFLDDHTFSGGISLLKGHNDFYDNFWDFIFSANYDGTHIEINANGNWWEDLPEFYTGDYLEYIDVLMGSSSPPEFIADYESMDPDQNVRYNPTAGNRFEEGTEKESNGDYEDAYNDFSTILDEKLETEKKYWISSMDRLYNLSILLENDLDILSGFFQNFYDNIPEFIGEDDMFLLQKSIKNYIKKCHFNKKEYQHAADIVVERIDNPISSVDSLFALMELESIYLISSLDQIGRANEIRTAFEHIKPNDIFDLNEKKSSHLSEIYNILGINNEENDINDQIPEISVLHSNYPNPFNPITTISFSIPTKSKVNLSIYNVKGQKVRTLLNEIKEQGKWKQLWDGKNNFGKEVGSGVYMYKLDVAGKTRAVKKCLLLK